MRSFQIIQAAVCCSARDELHEKQAALADGHEKQAMPFLRMIPAALRTAGTAARGLMGGAARTSGPGLWNTFKGAMMPGATRSWLGSAMRGPVMQGVTNPGGWMQQAGNYLTRSGAAATGRGLIGLNSWNKAGILGKAGKIFGSTARNALPMYGAQQLLSGYNQSQELQDAYAQGGGEAMAYLKANPMKNLGMMFSGADTIGSKLQGLHPSFGPRTANAFRGAYDFYNNNPSDSQIGARVSNDLHSRAGWRAWS